MLPPKNSSVPPEKVNSLRLTAVLAYLCLGCACSGVPLRADGSPGPEKCPDEALKTMKLIQLQPGDSAFVEIDANQTSQSPITLSDGPVESFLDESLGPLLPPTTRLYGNIWTGGPSVVIRYYEARPPNSDRIPICAVARLSRGGMVKKDSRPGVAVLEYSRAAAWIVDEFR